MEKRGDVGGFWKVLRLRNANRLAVGAICFLSGAELLFEDLVRANLASLINLMLILVLTPNVAYGAIFIFI